MDINHLTQSLELFMSPDQNKVAENTLNKLQVLQGYGPCLFTILMGNHAAHIKMAAAIAFKNFVKKNWSIEDTMQNNICESDRQTLKSQIIDLMLGSEIQIQKQLSESVSIIGKSDFPDNWTSLLPHLVFKIQEGNFHVINGVLQTCHSLFKRYRYEVRSDKLFLEIKQVISALGEPLMHLTQQTLDLIMNQHANDKNALLILWNSVMMIEKIFLSINHQDLPEFFEDNMKTWMNYFHIILEYNNPMLTDSNNNENAGIMEEVKNQICEILCLYQRKYDEEFGSFLQVFVPDVLKIVLSTNIAPKFDILVSTSLEFLSLVAQRAHHRELFNQIVNLQQLCQEIIIPSIEFRQSDQDQFTEEPEEYIRLDIEGSMAQSRRKSACELVKSLCKYFESQVVNNFNMYIQQLLTNYVSNPQQNWRNKDSAMFLITSVASKGSTERLGVTETTEFVDLVNFYSTHVLPELQGQYGDNPVIKADCIKYLMAFRSKIPEDQLRIAFNLLVNYVNHQSIVVHSYASAAINKLLMVRSQADNKAVISTDNISNPTSVIAGLCMALKREGSEENEYVMQALMRCLCVIDSNVMSCMTDVVNFLKEKLEKAVKNPKKPKFNHFLIESIAICIKIVCGVNPEFISGFESILFPIFDIVLCQNVEEFVPYAFQLFSLMLDQHPPQTVTQQYAQLFPFLVNLELWECSGNVPALIRLLLSYLEKASGSIIADKLPDLINIFRKLNNSKALDSFGFSLITAIIYYLPQQQTDSYLKSIFSSCFQRLSSGKTTKYMKGFVTFLCCLMLVYPPSKVIQVINLIQNNIFQMVMDSAILANIQFVTEPVERKLCLMGLTTLTFDCPEVVNGNYGNYFKLLATKLSELISLYVNSISNNCDEETGRFVDVEDSINNTTKLNQLIFVKRKSVNPAKEVGDGRSFIAMKLRSFSQNPMSTNLFNSLDPTVRASLESCMQ